MENVLPIPMMTTTVIDNHIIDLTDLELKKEIAVFILGSFVYEKDNVNGFKYFNKDIETIPNFSLYVAFFVENKLLIQSKVGFKYAYDVDWNRYLEDYSFDSIVVKKLIKKLFPNLKQYLNAALDFLEPNITVS